MGKVGVEGFSFPLFFADQVVRFPMTSLTTNEVGGERLAQLSKKINRARLKTGIPVPSHLFESRGEGSAEDSIRSLVE